MGLHHVVIVGGGFGGLHAARALQRAPVEVTLVDRRNFHLFQPLLYQVATGVLSPANIASPLRAVLRKQKNTRVLLADVVDLEPAAHRVVFDEGSLEYDTLVLAAGSSHHYFGHPEWESRAPGLKTVEDATEMRRRILTAFEAAERETDPAARSAWLTFVIVGAGPTGVELAGALSEIAKHTLRENFRNIDPSQARILLIEGGGRVLPPYAPALSNKAEISLRRLGVEVMKGTHVTGIEPESVTIQAGEQSDRIATRTVLWAAGVQASPLGRILQAKAGATLDRAGRVTVQPDLTIAGHPEVFVLGDMAACSDASGKSLPGVAPVAQQQGRYVAHVILRRLRQGPPAPPFHYRDPGSMATIGRGAAVAQLGRLQLAGYPAWLAWLFIHVMNLVAFENRFLVLFQWAWSYITRNRSARLITGVDSHGH